MVELVINGTAHVGVTPLIVTKERFEVVAYTEILLFSR
jgi:hypothetical protein